MKPAVYLETTVPSYLTAWRSSDLMMAANQEATRRWWDEVRSKFDLFVSDIVLQECMGGDAGAAKLRVEAIAGIPLLDISKEAEALAAQLLANAALPANARTDALHIAVAALHGVDYLLTWNCRHIANATMRAKIERVCRDAGYDPPVICTPLELTEDLNDAT